MKPRAYTLQAGSTPITTHSWTHCSAVAWGPATGSQAAHTQLGFPFRCLLGDRQLAARQHTLIHLHWPSLAEQHCCWWRARHTELGVLPAGAWVPWQGSHQVQHESSHPSGHRYRHHVQCMVFSRCSISTSISLAAGACITAAARLQHPPPPASPHPPALHQWLTCQSGDPLPPRGGRPLP